MEMTMVPTSLDYYYKVRLGYTKKICRILFWQLQFKIWLVINYVRSLCYMLSVTYLWMSPTKPHVLIDGAFVIMGA